jgi:DNA-binding transcriptional MerR regulator
MLRYYSVNELAKLAGVSVRTLHLYDKMGLLKPSKRSPKGYRIYGQKELLKLQQVLFYKELDMPLREIARILDDPLFDLIKSLEVHRHELRSREKRIHILLDTIDKTISHLKNKTMLTDDELYEGIPKEQAEAWRKEATIKWGDKVEKSEEQLRKMSKSDLKILQAEQNQIILELRQLVNEDPTGRKVQKAIAAHYANIRKFWGTHGDSDSQADAYKGLGKLFAKDERYTAIQGKPDPQFATFICKAMEHYSDVNLLNTK